MNYLLKKAAYVKGLADGLDINEKSNEGRILLELVDLIDVIAEMMADTIEAQMDLEEYVDLLDEDLSELEDEVYDFDDDDDYMFDDFDDFDDCYFDDLDECCDEGGCECGIMVEEE
ncbi:MAG: hypothetical protein GXZ11_03675 [Tissierellia bacterium]|nr:hypothetical protein [Tissierellia bacterium]